MDILQGETFGNLIGMTLEQARKHTQKPYFVTPHILNGKLCASTDDFNTNRINVVIENNLIIAIKGIG